MVKVEDAAVTLDILPALSEMGFTRYGGGFVRFCFTHYLEHDAALSKIAGLLPDCMDRYETMSGLDLERSCSPLISDADQNYYLIPIRPSYARNLVDRRLSSSDMFGGDPHVLLRWSKVYYRTATHHKMLAAPGRILWYVSRSSREIAAVSHLDEVVLDGPKELFRRFRRYGTFEWKHLYEICGGDISKDVMALLFSHTFPLRRPVPLDEIRKGVRRGQGCTNVAVAQENTAWYFLEAVQTGIPGAIMSKSPKPLLLSLKPRYADLIFDGVKKAELRRRALVEMEGRDVFVYVTSPIMELRGGFRVGEVWEGTPQDIWKKVSKWAAVNKDDFDAYYAGQSIALCPGDSPMPHFWEFTNPPGLSVLRNQFDNFIVPQSMAVHKARRASIFPKDGTFNRSRELFSRRLPAFVVSKLHHSPSFCPDQSYPLPPPPRLTPHSRSVLRFSCQRL